MKLRSAFSSHSLPSQPPKYAPQGQISGQAAGLSPAGHSAGSERSSGVQCGKQRRLVPSPGSPVPPALLFHPLRSHLPALILSLTRPQEVAQPHKSLHDFSKPHGSRLLPRTAGTPLADCCAWEGGGCQEPGPAPHAEQGEHAARPRVLPACPRTPPRPCPAPPGLLNGKPVTWWL